MTPLVNGELDNVDYGHRDNGDNGGVCGEHPLKAIVKKIENAQPAIEQDTVVVMLGQLKQRAPRLWNAYENALASYLNCKLMSSGGSLG